MIDSLTQTASLLAREQFRIYRLQVFNWGTFSGLHDIPIAERGFLFVGRSGSGKSTLLDAFSALLVPPRWLDFNAAARETERSGRDRNFVSYVRGAWAEQKDGNSGEIATRFLRPGTTWSALAVSFRNALGQTVVLVQLFWLRGAASSNTDVRRLYLIFERPFDLRELEDFDLEVRKLKQRLPDVFIRDEFRPYCERFCRLLGISSEMALRLLHKTQSAKNLGDLNVFLREFMLDKPSTFEVADRLVNEFSELNAAHQAVIVARHQIQMLAPARDHCQRLEVIKRRRNELEELQSGLDNYREGQRAALLEQTIKALEAEADGIAGEIHQREMSLRNLKAVWEALNQQRRDLGGETIEQWEADKKSAEEQRDEKLRKRGHAETACRELGWTFSDSPHSFAELVVRARQDIEQWQASGNATDELRRNLERDLEEKEREFVAARREVEATKAQHSNIPAAMLDLRQSIAKSIGIAETALPFAGELLEVLPQEAQWRGAVERLLRGFALSLLVEERHYAALTNYLNATDLRTRLVYYRTSQSERSSARHMVANSVFSKLRVKEGNFATWLRAELQHRFDYACVDSLHAFRNTERALTREGQIRHGKTRHEKDDSRRIDDRRHWVLGFDNREKRALYEGQAQDLAQAISKLQEKINHLKETERDKGRRALRCQTLSNMQWQEIEVASCLSTISRIEQQLRQAREGNPELRKISEDIKNKENEIADAEQALLESSACDKQIAKEIDELQQKLDRLRQQQAFVPLTPYQDTELHARYAALDQLLTLDNVDEMARRVERALVSDVRNLEKERGDSEKAVENCFKEFKRLWPMDAGDLDATLASAPDFLAKLQRLETDGLPAHEHRFFELLQSQSNQNLAALTTHLNQERKAIYERLELVNESLREAQFNPGTYLHIHASDRQLYDVKEFKQEIQQALSHAWTEDREEAEGRFIVLRRIVERLASQEAEARRWREVVLDVRQHVEFIGRELDADGREVELYRSGAGKSGGQRQKLATTCLAAALRYQLGGNDEGLPIYAPVAMDEAFDKADNEFTELAMKIFANFGFQMIVATPLRSVMTLEPFIGGACFVDISDRRNSSVLLIEYDDERQRLLLPEQTFGLATAAIP